MAAGALLVFVFLISLVVRQLWGKQGVDNGGVTPAWGKVALIWFTPSLMLFIALNRNPQSRAMGDFIALFCFYHVLLFPSLYARLCIRMGWVKASYHLGRVSFIHHRHDPCAGALFNALEAALHISSPNRRRTQLEWLRGMLQQRRQPSLLGAFLVWLLLDYYLSETPSPQQFYRRLRSLDHAYT